jgi:hypothetical protein
VISQARLPTMADINSPTLLYAKGGLMLAVGVLAAGLLVSDSPTIRTVALLAVAVWGFCRAYYFAFYVIEHYVDPSFKFAGLSSFIRYVIWKKSDK